MDIGQTIKSLIGDLNGVDRDFTYTAQALADDTSFSKSFISQIISGKRIPNDQAIDNIGSKIQEKAKALLKLDKNRGKLSRPLEAIKYLKNVAADDIARENIVSFIFNRHVLDYPKSISLFHSLEKSKYKHHQSSINEYLQDEFVPFVIELLENDTVTKKDINKIIMKNNPNELEAFTQRIKNAFRNISIKKRMDILSKYFDVEDQLIDENFIKKLFYS